MGDIHYGQVCNKVFHQLGGPGIPFAVDKVVVHLRLPSLNCRAFSGLSLLKKMATGSKRIPVALAIALSIIKPPSASIKNIGFQGKNIGKFRLFIKDKYDEFNSRDTRKALL